MKYLGGLLLLLVCLISTTCAAAESIVMEVQAGKTDRIATPLFFPLPTTLRSAPGFELTRIDNQQAVAVQKTTQSPPQIVWLLEETLKAGDKRRFRLTPTKSPSTKSTVTSCRDNG